MQTSPLIATAIVWAGIGLLAIPLRQLTASHPGAQVQASRNIPAHAGTPSVLRLRLLKPAQVVEVRDMAGTVLWRMDNPPAGESEHAVILQIDGGRLDLNLTANFAPAAEEIAVFLTVMPDGLEDRGAHAIGPGTIDAHLAFAWPAP